MATETQHKKVPKTSTAKSRAAKKRRRNENRKLLHNAKRITGMTAEQLEIGHVDPVDAIQQVLDRTYAQLVVASREADNVPSTELWRDTMVGRLPNEWVRLEEDLRTQVQQIAGKMLHLNIEDRKAHASELIAAAIAPVLSAIIKDLKLTPEQKKKAPEIVRGHLQLLEGGGEG